MRFTNGLLADEIWHLPLLLTATHPAKLLLGAPTKYVGI